MKRTFEKWCEKNYHKLRERLVLQGWFDEDAYQDAFLAISEDVKRGMAILCPEKQITRLYRLYRKNNLNKGFAFIRPDDFVFFSLLPDDSPLPLEEVKAKPDFAWMVYSIKQFVRRNNPRMSAIVWEARNLQHQSITDISAFTELKYGEIRRINSSINQDVYNQFIDIYKRKLSV